MQARPGSLLLPISTSPFYRNSRGIGTGKGEDAFRGTSQVFTATNVRYFRSYAPRNNAPFGRSAAVRPRERARRRHMDAERPARAFPRRALSLTHILT